MYNIYIYIYKSGDTCTRFSFEKSLRGKKNPVECSQTYTTAYHVFASNVI